MKSFFLTLIFLFSSLAAEAQKKAILFQHVRVFDGTQVITSTNVLIHKGQIIKIGPDVADPDAQIIDGAGKTLLPGFIDAHTHIWGERSLEQALLFGVTSELDMFMPPRLAARLHQSDLDYMASFWTAGNLATAPGGHGTEYGRPIPTLTNPKEADGWVGDRIREGSDYIKIVYDHGLGLARTPRPTLSKETLAAVIAAAHKHGKLAVVHIGSLRDARDAIEAGADGLAHLFKGPSSDHDFGQLAAAHHVFVVPTLSVMHSVCGPDSAGLELAADANLKPFLTGEDVDHLEKTFPSASTGIVSCKGAVEAIKQLKAAGVPILAGSDAPNPGTLHGVTMHGELRLLVEAGLTPAEALAAATSAPAKAFHIPDRGSIAPGMRADLVLVKGNPDENILATRNIVAVYKRGIEADRRRSN
ncbi:MAG TPA: amidohydrolase family protein [Alphaproteobacteria bacterium]|nr:amidohydrolase family protein [Alphaproteobacteria bacterium]